LLIAGPSLHFGNFAVLNPQGIIALKQRQLLVTAVSLMMLVVVPVFIFTFFVIYKFRAGNKTSEYSPNYKALQWPCFYGPFLP